MDSLENALKNSEGRERAELLLELSDHTRQKDVEAAIAQAQEALNITEHIESAELKSKILQKLGIYHNMAGRNSIALGYFLSALKLERHLGHKSAESIVLRHLGHFYRDQSNDGKALDYYFQALRIMKAKGKTGEAAWTMTYIGNIYRDQNDFQQALSFYKQATQLAKKINAHKTVSVAALKAAIYSYKFGRVDEASAFFELALDAAKTLGSTHAQAGILLGMIETYQDQNLYNKALAINGKLLKIAAEQESNMLLGMGHNNAGTIYTKIGNLQLANKHFLSSIAYYEAIGRNHAFVTNKLMRNYLEQSLAAKAVQIGEKTLKKAKGAEPLHNQQALLETLVKAYEEQGDFQKVINAQRELIAINKRIFTEIKTKQIAEMQARYETAQKEQEIVLLGKKQEKAMLIRNALIVGILFISIIAFLFYNRQRLKISKNKTILENTRLKEQKLKQDLDFKNKQLTTHSLNLVQKNEVMKELKQRIGELQGQNGETDNNLRKLGQLVDYSFKLDRDWKEFSMYFEEVHTGFFDLLKNRFPDLTTSEVRLCALVKLNLTINEISTILNISPDSVKTARYRLRKKMNLENDEKLSISLNKIEQEVTSL